MSISDTLGRNGIFLSDEARDQLNIRITPEEFNRLKSEINKNNDPDEVKKCYITNKYVKIKDGLFLDSTWVADAIEKNIESQDKLWKEFKDNNTVICGNCGTKNTYEDRVLTCSNCGENIDIKKYKKSIKLPLTKKMAMRLYVKYLRGKTL